jgi:hypothetical protein
MPLIWQREASYYRECDTSDVDRGLEYLSARFAATLTLPFSYCFMASRPTFQGLKYHWKQGVSESVPTPCCTLVYTYTSSISERIIVLRNAVQDPCYSCFLQRLVRHSQRKAICLISIPLFQRLFSPLVSLRRRSLSVLHR